MSPGFFARLSIGRKLLVGIMLTSVITLLLTTGALLLQDYHSLREDMRHDLGVITRLIAENLNAALYFQDAEAARETLSTLTANPYIRGGWLFAADGSLFASYAADEANEELDFQSLGVPMFGQGELTGEDFIAIYTPVHVDGEPVGSLYVESTLQELNDLMRGYLKITSMVLLAGVLVAFTLSTLFQRLIARPVLSLAQTALRISRDKDYTLRAQVFGEDELGQLSRTFNQMLTEVQRRDDALAHYSHELELEVAERADIQQQLLAAKELAEEASQHKSEFLSTVSHELRTPLTSVRGYAKLIRKRLQGAIFPNTNQEDPKVAMAVRQVAENLEVILTEGERLTSLVNDVLDLNKLDSGVVEWAFQPCDLGEMISHVVNVCDNLLIAKSLECSLEVEDDLPPLVLDRNRIIQVLINLVSNSVKFTPKGKVLITAMRRNEDVLVNVEDSGVGVESNSRSVVFERFRQLGDTLTDRPTGTGLGLAISKQIIEAHGGHIWVEDSELGGSAFRFILPLGSKKT